MEQQQSSPYVNRDSDAEKLEIPKDAVWMDSTVFKNTLFMHVQNRNIHGKIFGGFILKTAFELAFITAQCLMGRNNVEFMYVNDIQFVKPVSVGAVIEFGSAVVYSTGSYIVVQVTAVDVSGNSLKTKTNVFSYVFQ